jgi:hypothetical protein
MRSSNENDVARRSGSTSILSPFHTPPVSSLFLFSLTCNQSAIRSSQKIARKRRRSDATPPLGSFPNRLISASSSPPPPPPPPSFLLLSTTPPPHIHKAATDAHNIARAAPNAPAGGDAVVGDDGSLDVAADKTLATKARRDFHELSLLSSIKSRWTVLGDIIFVVIEIIYYVLL